MFLYWPITDLENLNGYRVKLGCRYRVKLGCRCCIFSILSVLFWMLVAKPDDLSIQSFLLQSGTSPRTTAVSTQMMTKVNDGHRPASTAPWKSEQSVVDLSEMLSSGFSKGDRATRKEILAQLEDEFFFDNFVTDDSNNKGDKEQQLSNADDADEAELGLTAIHNQLTNNISDDAETEQILISDDVKTEQILVSDDVKTEQILVSDDAKTEQILVSDDAKTEQILIISWTDMYIVGRSWFGAGRFLHCPLPGGTRCIYEHGPQSYDQSDVVLFRAAKLNNAHLPAIKHQGQKWVLFETESPVSGAMQSFKRGAYHGAFDYVASYAPAANISIPYGTCVHRKTLNLAAATKNYAKGKTRGIAWFVSHCVTHSRREKYVQELQKYIPVDVYGDCGTHRCNKSTPKVCENLLKAYKYYLAFENALCEDYITEKLYRSFELGILPIVYGAAAYEQLLPKRSFIDIRYFRSPRHLAQYLRMLDRNDDLYNEYFSWKSSYKCQRFDKREFPCKLCKFVHSVRNNLSRPVDLEEFWGESNNCVEPHAFQRNCSCW